MTVGISELWTAAGVLLGFQVTSFLWRIAQEVDVASRDDICWLPPADLVNLAGMLVLVAGVFLAPILAIGDESVPLRAFGLAAVLFVGHCFALAGHYELFNNRTKRSFIYFPFQEKVVVGLLGAIVALYFVAVWSAPQRSSLETDEERYTSAFAQNIDASVGPNESCRQSLAEVLYAPVNEAQIVRQGASSVFVFTGTVETYRIHAFRSERECEAALDNLRSRP